MDTLRKEKELVWLQILYLFIIPVLLMYFDVFPSGFRIPLLLVISILLFGIVKHNNWTSSDFGIKKDFMKDIIPYTLFTIGGVFFILWLSYLEPRAPLLRWWQNTKFLLLFIPVSILQEIIFRGILMNMLMRAFKNPIFIIFLNAIIFSLMHVIYFDFKFVLPVTFIAGVGFAWMYYQYRNLPLVSISHIILNFMAMILGFFVIR
jgi:membrane protease YdiL (CAAX protease family)